ncbi:hypothetical protein JAAARDRAFT_37807 [Jaapia argillacea MUCL 33604]|uniref:FAD dependent oxidoreductase domain-containing protein n=1 Tax=Jaapia argillacea MUCL 33604 TaxID=933084 RepID=A0A067PK35_9AGAM|nr:hypothetical protein JAAARDRAFT_37807 [Jaapia argillacea MUCL 33604]
MSAEKVLIVGGGCFGLFTAFHLLNRRFVDVTFIDRSNVLSAPDAASTDSDKIVQTSYSDTFYARFAKEAIDVWKDEKEWDDTYHECGVLVLNSVATHTSAAHTRMTCLCVRSSQIWSMDLRLERFFFQEFRRYSPPSHLAISTKMVVGRMLL